ncbi:36.4 kDa proline-rich protein-like [Senna tora]|uniref:36.4 kDa proline-rich protein-like n=1 Tax=Senna tora TaxID=362788 RepID=A0A834T5I2_9FABA|nr:36.4 kDa proline-rich protein-like [Senna tora]
MMNSKAISLFFISLISTLNAMPPLIHACGTCNPPHHHHHHPKTPKPKPPHHGGHPPIIVPAPPIIVPAPPVIVPAPPVIVTPPPVAPPVVIYPPVVPAPPEVKTCPIDALKLGLCLDVLGGLVHVGIGNPVENICCPVIQGLLELEAAICLCTVIRLKLLNLNVFLPLALQVLITCGLTPPPGFVCPPLT